MKRTFPAIIFIGMAIAMTPAAHAEEAYAAEGAGLTLELQEVNIFDVFRMLSKRSSLNIVAGRNVHGQVSIFLQNIPVRKALTTILESQGLASIEEDGIIKVMTAEDYQKEYGRPFGDSRVNDVLPLEHMAAEAAVSHVARLKSQRGEIFADPRSNSVFFFELPAIIGQMKSILTRLDSPRESLILSLEYAKAEDIEEKLRQTLAGTSAEFQVDERSNSIFLKDIPTRLRAVARMVEAFDVAVPQVLIEAKIIEVRLDDSYRHGINWNHISHEIAEFDSLKATAPLTVATPTGASAFTTMTLGESNDNTRVILDLLQHMGKTNLLSSPRLTVLSGKEAKLAVATREPFVSQTIVQTTNSTNTADEVQFVDVGVTLKVLPRITRDGTIELQIRPEVSSSNQSIELEGVAQGSNTTFTRTRIPVVTSQELETTVLVKSGTTIIIGGLIQDRQEKSNTRVPILGALPLIGHLFQSKSYDYDKTELVTFLVPRIIEPENGTREDERFLERGESRLKPFSDVGGYAYRPTDHDVRRLAGTGRRPYWEADVQGESDKRGGEAIDDSGS